MKKLLLISLVLLLCSGCSKTYKFDLDSSIDFSKDFINSTFYDMNFAKSAGMMHPEMNFNAEKLQGILAQGHPYGFPDTIEIVSFDTKNAISPIHFVLNAYIGEYKKLYVLSIFKGTSDKYVVTGLNFISKANENKILENLNVLPINKKVVIKAKNPVTVNYEKYLSRVKYFIIPKYQDNKDINIIFGNRYRSASKIRSSIGLKNILNIHQIYGGKDLGWGLVMSYKTELIDNESELIGEANYVWKKYGRDIAQNSKSDIFVLGALHTIDDPGFRTLFQKNKDGKWYRRTSQKGVE